MTGEVVIEECDLCGNEFHKDLCAEIRIDYPEWFDGDGKGNLRNMELYTRKCREEWKKRVPKIPVFEVKCGFCDEPFRVCGKHLQEMLLALQASQG